MSKAESGDQTIPTTDLDDVSVIAVDADACTALGCTEHDDLKRVTIDGYGTRVLCPEDAAALIKREVLR